MSEEIFRKKSLDRIKSPESLNDYVKVANPGVWLLLAAVAMLLIGACIWGAYGRIDTTVQSRALIENGTAVCIVDRNDADRISAGMEVRFENGTGTVSGITFNPDGSCSVELDTDMPDGTYDVQIVIESIKPFSFILN